jgi:hypothetical protein
MEVKIVMKRLRLTAVQHKKRIAEYARLADLSCTTCEPPVEEHCIKVHHLRI